MQREEIHNKKMRVYTKTRKQLEGCSYKGVAETTKDYQRWARKNKKGVFRVRIVLFIT